MAGLLETLRAKMTSEADIKWCEPNHVTFPTVIAEPFNTASSLALVLVGLYGYSSIGQYPLPRVAGAVEWRMKMLYLALLVNGLGSVVHHGTMMWFGQVLDELPSLWGTMLMLFALVATNPRKGDNISTMLTMHTALATGAYLFWGFQYYAGAQGLSAMAVVLLSAHACFSKSVRGLLKEDQSKMRSMCLRGLGLLGFGFFGVWLPEHTFCETYPSYIQPLRLHAIFHLLCAAGTYHMICFVQYFSYERWSLKPKISFQWGIPVVIPVKDVKK